MEDLIEKWKEYNINRAEFEFYAGGDSMGDTDLYFFDKENKEVTVEENFKDKIETEIYHNVEFYVNSDGHYQGESGTVIVTLLEQDGEEPELSFTKDSQSEYCNNYTDTIKIQLTKEEYEYLKEHVYDITSDYSYDIDFHYAKDFYMDSEKYALQESIKTKIKEACDDHDPEYEGDGEVNEIDYYDLDSLEFLENNIISLNFGYSATEYENGY